MNTISLGQKIGNSPSVTKQLGAILLVSGTTVGGGMLALPIVTGEAGFGPSAFLLLGYWVLSLLTALLILEVNLYLKPPVNLIGMAKHTLGKGAAIAAWCIYLLLLYSLTAAYLAASGPLIDDIVFNFIGFHLPLYAQSVPFFALFAGVIYLGIRPVDYLNRILMVGLILSYSLLLMSCSGHISLSLLTRAEPLFLWATIPVISTSYGFHIIIPNLTSYLNRDVKSIKRSIIIGSVIPLIVYLVFEFIVLGIIDIEHLRTALIFGEQITKPLSDVVKNTGILTSARLFSFFAITTSFLGVGVSLFQFFADELKIEQTHKGKLATMTLTFGLPILFVLFYPKGFIVALQYAGVCVVLLLGILPVLMAWAGRKMKPFDAPYTVAGGTPLLAGLLGSFLAVCAYMIYEVLKT